MTGSKGHFGVDGDVVPRTFEPFVERSLDGTLPVHDNRGEFAFPFCIPVHRRHEGGVNLGAEFHAFKGTHYNSQFMGIVKLFLDVTFQVRIFIAE